MVRGISEHQASNDPLADAIAGSVTELSGPLPRGARYRIHVPQAWNGVLINNLDYAEFPTNPDFYGGTALLAQGYAMAGSSRLLGDPQYDGGRYDLHYDLDNQVRVLDLFTELIEQPRCTLQLGGSLGGIVTVGMAEMHADRLDGAIAMCGTSPTVTINMFLDLTFALRVLLDGDPDLPLVTSVAGLQRVRAWMPQDSMIEYLKDRDASEIGDEIARFAHSALRAVSPAWVELLTAAQETAAGRARIALAVTLAQWPAWGGHLGPAAQPDPGDMDAVQDAMFASAFEGVMTAVAGQPGTPQGMPYWNTGVDYVKFYQTADAWQQDTVQALYRRAGLDPVVDLQADLERIDHAGRVRPDSEALQFWRTRTFTGKLAVPLLHVQTLDATVPPVVMKAYEVGVHAHGKADLYRQVVVGRANHHGLSLSEVSALVETLMRRIESGGWADPVNAAHLNDLARSFGFDDAKFIDYELPTVANRAFFPDTPVVG